MATSAPESFVHVSEWIAEASTYYYTRVLTDELGQALTSTALTTVTFTLYETDTPAQAIINGIDGMDVKNANIGTVTTSGKLELRLRPMDTIILNTTRLSEHRRGLLIWTFAGGAKQASHEIDWIIRNRHKLA